MAGRAADARPASPAAGAPRRAARDGASPLVLLWTGDFTPKLRWTLTAILVVALARLRAGAARAGRPAAADGLEPPRRAARGGLLDPRARGAAPTTRSARCSSRSTRSPQTLREQRLGALEATALLSKVMEEIDVAVFAFDERGRAAARQPRGETPPRPARAAAARPARRGARPRARSSWASAPRIREARVPRRRGPLGGAHEHLPPGRRARTSSSCSPT